MWASKQLVFLLALFSFSLIALRRESELGQPRILFPGQWEILRSHAFPFMAPWIIHRNICTSAHYSIGFRRLKWNRKFAEYSWQIYHSMSMIHVIFCQIWVCLGEIFELCCSNNPHLSHFPCIHYAPAGRQNPVCIAVAADIVQCSPNYSTNQMTRQQIGFWFSCS